MAGNRGDKMTIQLVSDEKIAETSSKGNQEKWYDSSANCWYKLDQFGYEALAETVVSTLLERSNIEADTPFTFVRYHMERLQVHGRERTGCSSKNFLRPGQALITVNRLLSSHLGRPLREKLVRLSSDRKRIAYLAEATAELTGLESAFWGHVQDRTPPPLDGSNASARFLSERFPNSTPKSHIALPDTAVDLLTQYDEACEQLEIVTEQKQQAENLLKEMMGEKEVGTAGDRVVTWKSMSQERLDSKTLKAEHPALCKKYTNKTSYRRFTVKAAS